MNKHEFMVGNYIAYLDKNVLIAATIAIVSINDDDRFYIKRKGIPIQTDLESIKPIELNPQLLKILGATQKDATLYTLDLLSTSSIDFYFDGELLVELSNSCNHSFGYPKIKYLHQLQNLYRVLENKKLALEENQLNNLLKQTA